MTRKDKQKFPEQLDGTFSALPHSVLDSQAYMGASFKAKAMLVEAARQLNGKNNGHLQLSAAWLKKRGWTSNDTFHAAIEELLARRLLVKTRQGGLNIGPSWYAVTWLVISNFVGLELRPQEYHRGAYRFMDTLQVPPKLKSLAATGRSGGRDEAGVYRQCGSSVSRKQCIYAIPCRNEELRAGRWQAWPERQAAERADRGR